MYLLFGHLSRTHATDRSPWGYRISRNQYFPRRSFDRNKKVWTHRCHFLGPINFFISIDRTKQFNIEIPHFVALSAARTISMSPIQLRQATDNRNKNSQSFQPFVLVPQLCPISHPRPPSSWCYVWHILELLRHSVSLCDTTAIGNCHREE